MALSFTNLPYDIQGEIFSHLDPKSALHLRQTCKLFNNERLLSRANGTWFLRSSQESCASFLSFCEPNKGLAAAVKDLTLDFKMENFKGFDLKTEVRKIKFTSARIQRREVYLPAVIIEALCTIAERLTHLKSFRVIFAPHYKTDNQRGNEETLATALEFKFYVECFRWLFQGNDVDPLEEESRNSEITTPMAFGDDGFPIASRFQRLKSLGLHNVEALNNELHPSAELTELISRVESLSMHISAEKHNLGINQKPRTKNWLLTFRDYLDALSPCAMSLNIEYDKATPLWGPIGQNSTITENIAKLHLKFIIFKDVHINWIHGCKSLRDLKLVRCDIHIPWPTSEDDDDDDGYGKVFWYDLWEKLLEREKETGVKVFDRLELVESGYAFPQLYSGTSTFWPHEDPDGWEDYINDLDYVRNFMTRDQEMYERLGGIGDNFYWGDYGDEGSEDDDSEDSDDV